MTDAGVGIISALCGAGILKFIEFLITRKDQKKNNTFDTFKKEIMQQIADLRTEVSSSIKEVLEEGRQSRANLHKELEDFEKKSDAADLRHDQAEDRQQMLFLMEHRPNDVNQLLTLAEHYFIKLNGDWYMSSLFKDHCLKHQIPLPIWFHED